MGGIRALRKLQFAPESTAGVIQPATRVWRGMGTIEDMRTMVFPHEDIGLISMTDRSYVSKYAAGLHLDQVEATFEQFPTLLEMSVKTASSTQDGSTTASDWIYQYDFPTTSVPTIKTHTWEGGDNQEAEVMEYVFASNWNISGAAGEAWKMDAELRGRQVAVQAFTSSTAATIPTVEDMLVSKSKLYIDPIGSTSGWGTTLQSNTLLSASISYVSGWKAKFTMDGSLAFSFLYLSPPEVKLSLTFEHDTISAGEKVNWRAQTARLLRIKCEGSAFASTGTLYGVKTGIFDVAGKWSKFAKLGEKDGNDVLQGDFISRYDATAAKFGRIIWAISSSSLPF